MPSADPNASPPTAAPITQDLGELISQIGQGNRIAFARCYELTSAHVMGLVARMLPQRDQAELVVQEVYLTVWRSAAGFANQRSQPMTWLMSITRHRALEALGRLEASALAGATASSPAGATRAPGSRPSGSLPRMQERPAMTVRAGQSELAADTTPPPELLGVAMLARAVRGCLYALSPEQQQSLALAYYHGLSHAEVAEQLHQRPATVRTWLRAALPALRSCMERRADAA